MEPVLGALAAAHRAGLVHRDVKPENILLSDDGVVKVADFGLARAVEADAASTRTGLMMGTVAYCAPEQIARGRADPRSDVYSAGIVLFELLTGRRPYRGESAMNVAYQHVHSRVPAPSSPAPRASRRDRRARAARDRQRPGRPAARRRRVPGRTARRARRPRAAGDSRYHHAGRWPTTWTTPRPSSGSVRAGRVATRIRRYRPTRRVRSTRRVGNTQPDAQYPRPDRARTALTGPGGGCPAPGWPVPGHPVPAWPRPRRPKHVRPGRLRAGGTVPKKPLSRRQRARRRTTIWIAIVVLLGLLTG